MIAGHQLSASLNAVGSALRIRSSVAATSLSASSPETPSTDGTTLPTSSAFQPQCYRHPETFDRHLSGIRGQRMDPDLTSPVTSRGIRRSHLRSYRYTLTTHSQKRTYPAFPKKSEIGHTKILSPSAKSGRNGRLASRHTAPI